MNNPARQLAQSHDVATKVAQMFQTRTRLALERFGERGRGACDRQASAWMTNPMLPWTLWTSGAQYAVDFARRSVLLWDTLRQRGNNFVEHERQGLPPVLHFDALMKSSLNTEPPSSSCPTPWARCRSHRPPY